MILAAGVGLVFFLGLTGSVLERAFRSSLQEAERERLIGHVYALLSAADVGRTDGLEISPSLPESRFATPNSGLYGRVLDRQGAVVWRSPSNLGVDVAYADADRPGEVRFATPSNQRGALYFTVALRVQWEVADDAPQTYVFQVSADRREFNVQLARFRTSLWGWFAAVALALLIGLGLLLRWGLSPLRRVAADLERVQNGEDQQLAQDYPRELLGLTRSINAFIVTERAQRDRYRNSLSDLAHSLKTPLAVMRSTVQGGDRDETSSLVREQVDRMDEIVQYQLQRAAASGGSPLGRPLPLRPLVLRIVDSLRKVYFERGVEVDVRIDERREFYGDQGDLMEILGNVLDNAFKWCQRQVRVFDRAAYQGQEGAWQLVVEDDGPGIPMDLWERVLQRGVRADERVKGHGIGLAVVRDLLEVYEGHIELGRSELGGARICLSFPTRARRSDLPND